MDRIRAWLDANPKVRAAIKTAVIAFGAVFIPSLLGFLGDVQEWANGVDQDFPSVSTLAKASVGAAAGLVAGIVSYIWNSLPWSHTPAYTPPVTEGQ